MHLHTVPPPTVGCGFLYDKEYMSFLSSLALSRVTEAKLLLMKTLSVASSTG